MNTKLIGDVGQRIAVKYVKKLGWKVLEENYLVHGGEIDIIASDKKEFVFIEVKSRSSEQYGSPADAVTYAKQQHIVKAARVWLHSKKSDFAACRFAVIEILDGEINLIDNAFEI